MSIHKNANNETSSGVLLPVPSSYPSEPSYNVGFSAIGEGGRDNLILNTFNPNRITSVSTYIPLLICLFVFFASLNAKAEFQYTDYSSIRFCDIHKCE